MATVKVRLIRMEHCTSKEERDVDLELNFDTEEEAQELSSKIAKWKYHWNSPERWVDFGELSPLDAQMRMISEHNGNRDLSWYIPRNEDPVYIEMDAWLTEQGFNPLTTMFGFWFIVKEDAKPITSIDIVDDFIAEMNDKGWPGLEE